MGTSSPPSTEYDNVGTTWIISGLTNTVAEYCAFKACNTAGCSSLSNIATATPTAVLSAPGVPMTVAAVAGNMQNTVSWSAPSGGGTVASYNLYWSNTDMGSNCLAGTNVPNVSSPDVITSLTNGTTYFYMLKAINSAGASNCSAEVSATPSLAVPGAPTSVAAVAGNTIATMSWGAPVSGGTVSQYNIGCANASNTETFTSFANVTSPANVTGLTNGLLYYCKCSVPKHAQALQVVTEVTVTPIAQNENYTTYTNVGSGFTVASSTSITYSGLVATDTSKVYKDFGVGYFGVNFTHDVDVVASSNSGSSLAGVWIVSNNLDSVHGLTVNSESNLSVYILVSSLWLNEDVSGTDYTSTSATLTAGTTYYLQIQRNSSVGTYGTLYLYIYDTSAHRNGCTGLLATKSLALHNNNTWRYLYAGRCLGMASETGTISGSIANLKIVQ